MTGRKMFLDDERFPAEESGWDICRSFDEAVAFVKTNGIPAMISFDHDLGTGKTGHDFAKWLCEHMLDNHIEPTFAYYVHSQNPIGKANIEGLLEAFFRSQDSGEKTLIRFCDVYSSYEHKGEIHQDFDRERALAILLAEEVVFLNTHWWRED